MGVKYVPKHGGRTEAALVREALDNIAQALVAIHDAIPTDDYREQRRAMKAAAIALLPAYDALKEIETNQKLRAKRGPYKRRKSGDDKPE